MSILNLTKVNKKTKIPEIKVSLVSFSLLCKPIVLKEVNDEYKCTGGIYCFLMFILRNCF